MFFFTPRQREKVPWAVSTFRKALKSTPFQVPLVTKRAGFPPLPGNRVTVICTVIWVEPWSLIYFIPFLRDEVFCFFANNTLV